jgi:hypothetical protein
MKRRSARFAATLLGIALALCSGAATAAPFAPTDPVDAVSSLSLSLSLSPYLSLSLQRR